MGKCGTQEGSALVSNATGIYKSFKERTGRMCPVAKYGTQEGSAMASNDKSIYKSFKEMKGRKCPAAKENVFCLTSLQGKLRFKVQHRQIVLCSETQEVFTNCNCNRIAGAEKQG